MENKMSQSSLSRRSVELLQALNATAASFQRSAHSETAVLRAYQEQLASLNLRGGLSLLDETGTHLTVRVVNYAGRTGQILSRFEKLTGLKTENFTFPIADVDVYQQVVETCQTQYVDDSSTVVAQMLPQKARRYLGRIITAFGAQPAIYAPIINDGRAQGVINIVDADITPDDVPALTALANQIAVALDNARLFEEARQRAKELEQRVADRTQELATANKRLQELDRLKTQLISTVSHELRTPITTLELYLDLMKYGDEDKRAHYLKIVEEQVHRLAQLVDDILDLSRLEAGSDKMKLTPISLNPVVEKIVAMQEAQATEKGLEMQLAAAENLPPVLGSTNQISQVITNLVVNSINYTDAGHIHVSTYLDEEKGRVCLQVSDTGMGIHPEDRPHIMERFYRGQFHERRNLPPGTGLGLAIVKEIVKVHNGEIDFESKVGEGTTFRVWLLPGGAG